MNTFWLKIAAGAVGVVVILVMAGHFFSGGDKPAPRAETPRKEHHSIMETKSFSSQVDEDRDRLSVEPEPIAPPVNKPASPSPQPASPMAPQTETQTPALAADVKPSIIYVKPMQEYERVDADQLWQTAVPGRSIGRLPMTGYSLAIKGCKEIIQRYPDSKYAFMATRLLREIPERRRARVTDQELNISRFYQQRPGTVPMQVKESE